MTPRFESGAATFTALARGPGDCGTFARHRVVGPGRAETLEVQECRASVDPHSAPLAGGWPVVYSAR